VEVQLEVSLLTGFMLALVRAGAWMAVCPPFATRAIPVQVKVGFSVALAIVVAPKMQGRLTSLETGPFVFGLVKEAVIGLVLGFTVQLVFSAVQAAGSLIDLFGGFTLATAYDPLSLSQSSVFGRLYGLIATTLLFALDGHVLLVRGFLRSFDLGSPTAAGLAESATTGLGRLMLAAFEIAAPLIGALFLADVVLGLLTRSAPQLNAFALGFPLKILLSIVLAGLCLPLLPETVLSLVEAGVTGGLRIVGAGSKG
jgi:flagellar biosynthetic protein FliR